jgi:hypothetical protein
MRHTQATNPEKNTFNHGEENVIFIFLRKRDLLEKNPPTVVCKVKYLGTHISNMDSFST